MPICPRTGITIPECSCSACLEEQVRRYMPGVLAMEVRVIHAAHVSAERGRQRQSRTA